MKTIILMLTLFVLIGCTTPALKIEAKPIERIPLGLPAVDQYESHKIEWIVVTRANQEKVFNDLEKKGIPVAIIGITGDTYKVLGIANADKRKLIRQLNAQIAAYEKYYIAIEKRDVEHNEVFDETE